MRQTRSSLFSLQLIKWCVWGHERRPRNYQGFFRVLIKLLFFSLKEKRHRLKLNRSHAHACVVLSNSSSSSSSSSKAFSHQTAELNDKRCIARARPWWLPHSIVGKRPGTNTHWSCSYPDVQLIRTIKTQTGQMRKIRPSFKVRQGGDAITASHLCTGGGGVTPPTTTLPPHPDVQPDTSPSECYLLQKESALIAHTCDLRPHKSISPISVGTSPPSKCLHPTPHPPP